MNQESTISDRADSSAFAGQREIHRTTFSKVVRRIARPMTRLLTRLAPAATRFALRWQPEGTWRMVVAERRRLVDRLLYDGGNGIVDGGPFRGMKLSDGAAWGDGHLAAKLLGCYEQELHLEIETFVQRGYDKVIVVGCAEGYYAVGLGHRMRKAQVIAFEASPDGQRICRENAELNGIAERLSVRGNCTVSTLNDALTSGESVFLLMDCEGAERQLLDPQAIPRLTACDFIVECHDFMDVGITETLMGRFRDTHSISKLSEGPRDANSHRLLAGLRGIDRELAVCECRPQRMNWLIARRHDFRA